MILESGYIPKPQVFLHGGREWCPVLGRPAWGSCGLCSQQATWILAERMPTAFMRRGGPLLRGWFLSHPSEQNTGPQEISRPTHFQHSASTQQTTEPPQSQRWVYTKHSVCARHSSVHFARMHSSHPPTCMTMVPKRFSPWEAPKNPNIQVTPKTNHNIWEWEYASIPFKDPPVIPLRNKASDPYLRDGHHYHLHFSDMGTETQRG